MEMLLRRIVGAMQVYAGKQPTLIKMKSWSCRDIEWFTHCFPRARFLFISRSTTDWATSFIETFDHQPRTLLSTLKVGAAAHRHLEETGRLTNFIRYEEFARAPVALMKGILGLDVDAGLDGRLSEVASQNSQGKVLTKTEMPREELEARLVQLKQLISEDSALLASPIVYERDGV
jgi:hypothetical protein